MSISHSKIPSLVFLGNCQIKAITGYCMFYLNCHIKHLNINDDDLEHHNDSIDILISNADIIVMQPFRNSRWYYNNDQINKLKNKTCHVITVHVLYYNGYFPQETILNYYELDKNIELANTIIEKSNISLEELHKRENDVDIPIYHFIKDNFQKKRLFLTNNHPFNYLLNVYAYLIYKKIINDISYFKNNVLIEYNYNFDNSCELLHGVDHCTAIDIFTYESLKLDWDTKDST